MSGHGWTEMFYLNTDGLIRFADVPDQRRCGCIPPGLFTQCNRAATQEDFLCDGCRNNCAATGETE